MSSTNKTKNLKLNQWVGTDIPQRADFVADNDIIDRAVNNHTSNGVIHVTQSDKDTWNAPYHKFTYTGDGKSPREVVSNCPFKPTWGIVFANSYTPSVCDISNNSNYNYFGIFSNTGNMAGLSIINGRNIQVYQSSTAVQKTEYRNYNQSGVIYSVFMFR